MTKKSRKKELIKIKTEQFLEKRKLVSFLSKSRYLFKTQEKEKKPFAKIIKKKKKEEKTNSME